jgi:glutamine amidotransferase
MSATAFASGVSARANLAAVEQALDRGALVFAAMLLIGAAATVAGAPQAAPWLSFLLSIFVGLEGPALRISPLCAGAAGTDAGVVIADNADDAEIRVRLFANNAGDDASARFGGCSLRRAASPPCNPAGARPAVLSGIALTMRVAIIDYGSGNLRSATKAFERAAREAGIDAQIDLTADADRVRTADRIVLPGVGAYADCRAGLDAVPGMVEAIDEVVDGKGRPFLGICVGMQLMSQRGLEKTVTNGLGWIAGDVKEIVPSDPALKIPQIGWNTLTLAWSHPLFDGIKTGPDGLHAYFVHSYHLDAKSPNRCWRRLTMAEQSPPLSSTAIAPAHSFIPKRARRSAWP